jgi:L-threonylcarbamoyladenylate synthase
MTLIPTPISSESIAECVEFLAAGELAIVPTDTVYGIAADALNKDAVHSLYRAKGKEFSAPLQLLFSNDAGMIARYAALTPAAATLIEALGPGAWTIITRASPSLDSEALAGGTTVGIRIPGIDVVQDIVALLGRPLAASSGNRHGLASPTTCLDATQQLGDSCAIALDSGPTLAGLDSTVIDCSVAEDLKILREGAIDRQTVARILGMSDIPVLRSVRP